MATFNYNLKAPSSTKPTVIRLFIRWNNERIVYSTGEKINPKYWNPERGKGEFWCYPLNRFTDLNHRLSNFRNRAQRIFRRWLDDHDEESPTNSQLKIELDIAFDRIKKEGFYDFFEKQIDIMDIKPQTKKTYNQTLNLLKQLYPRLNFNDFNMEFESVLKKSLEEYGLNANSRGKHIKNLKRILKLADNYGLLKDRAYHFYVQEREGIGKIYLNPDELHQMYTLDLGGIEKRARDLFLLGAYTGLRYSDFNSLISENIKDGYIIKIQQKTEEDVLIPMHPIVEKILENGIPHPMSNQILNKFLKTIGQKFLNKKVSIKSERVTKVLLAVCVEIISYLGLVILISFAPRNRITDLNLVNYFFDYLIS